jgi:hypothetical protein
MMDELEDLHMIRLKALENIEKNKMWVAKYHNKKVKVKQFAEGDLVWKALLPIGTKYSTFSKWSPNWEGPFRVVRCAPGNAYILKTLLGEEFTAAINGRYLKKYYPNIEVDRWLQAPGLQASDTQKQPAFGKEAVFRTKDPNRGDGQYWNVLPLVQKYSTLQMFLQDFIWQPSYLWLQRGGKQKAWRKKRKYASFLWFLVFPLQLLPLQLFQNHHNSNLEASGVAMTCSFH